MVMQVALRLVETLLEVLVQKPHLVVLCGGMRVRHT